MTGRGEPTTDERLGGTDGFFGLVAGLYAAALVAPAVAIGVALRFSAAPGVLFFTLLGSTVVVAGAVGWPARRTALAVWLGQSPRMWTPLVLPFGYFGALALPVLAGGEAPSGPVAALAVVGALAGVLVGAGLSTAARNRHAKAVLADAEELARFSASAPERDRRVGKWAFGGLLAVSVVGFGVSVVTGIEPLRWLFQIVTPLGASLFGMTTERRVAVTDAGLLVGNAVSKGVRPWSDFESYSVTEEAIVVRRAGWSARGLRDVRRDASEVDREAVAAALGEFLPRE